MFSLENEVNPNSSSSSSMVFTSSSSTTIRELRADPTAAAVTAAAANAPAAVNFAISPSLELSVTVVYTVLYSCLFVFVYLQLWLVLHYGHKRLSYQTVFLFLCLLWAALRTTLFSFYFKNTSAVVALQASSRRLQPLVYWLLYCLPVCLQFFTLCLLNLYFAQLMFKAKAKYSPELTKYKIPLRLAFLCLGIFFLVVNLTCALLVQGALERFESPSDAGIRHAVLARVLVNDSLFVLCAISLAVCLFKIAKMSSANVYLESKGTSVCQATAIGALVVLLYTSRACYNLVVVSLSPQDQPSPFNYGWYNISEQADVQEVSGEAYIVFGIILFFWELLPTSLVVIFFRVQKPNQNLASGGMINSHSFSSRAYFFDNPRRYDSDDDLTRSITSRADRASLLTSAPQLAPSSWYGSIQRAGSLTGAMAPPRRPLLLYGPPALRLRERPERPPPPPQSPQLLFHAAGQQLPASPSSAAAPPDQLLLHASELQLRLTELPLHAAELRGPGERGAGSLFVT